MIRTNEQNYSRSHFIKQVHRYRKVLENRKIDSGTRVVLIADNSYEYIVALFSLLNLDCSIVLADSSLSKNEIHNIIEKTNANYILTNEQLKMDFSEKKLMLLKAKDSWISENDNSKNIFGEWINRKDALILFTSGSSGDSKGIVKSGKAFIENIEVSMKVMQYKENDVLLPLLPFSHFYGLSLIFIWWFSKSDIIITNYRKIRSIFKAIERFNVTIVDAVPSTYYIIWQLLKRNQHLNNKIKNCNIRMWCVGGSPLSKKLAKNFFEITGQHLLDGYGLSEIGNIALNTSSYETGCGQPLSGIQIRITNELGKQVFENQVGEIWIKTTYLMQCYLNNPKRTSEVITNGWFKTNDLGYLDQFNNLFIIGRKDDSFLRKGHIVYPANIEKKINDLFGFKSKIVRYDDIKKDSYVLLIIEAKISDSEKNSLKKSIYREFELMYQPDHIIFEDEFPYLSNGKVDLKKLFHISKAWINKTIDFQKSI